MRHPPAYRSYLAFLACALQLAATGCIREHTGLLLGVATDLIAPDELDEVRLRVLRDGNEIINEDWRISGISGQPINLPGSFSIYPEDEDETPTIEIELIGSLSGREIVFRYATLTMLAHQTLFLRMALVARCENIECDPDETCIEGVCAPRRVDATLLTRYVGNGPRELTAECQSRTQLRDTATRQPLFLMGEATCADGYRCIESVCYRVPPHCRDGVLNEDESAMDCGGVSCAGCPGTQHCNTDGDCLTGSCNDDEEPLQECTATLDFERTALGSATPDRASLAVGDFNQDGAVDLLVAYTDNNMIAVYLNRNDPKPDTPPFDPTISSSYSTVDRPVAISVNDFNSDRIMDVAIAYRSLAGDHDGIQVFLNDGSGSFARSASYPLGHRPTAITSGDLDADGTPDLVVTNIDDGTVSVLLNDGSGKFPSAADYPAGPEPVAVAIAALDDLHAADIVVVSTDVLGIDGQVILLHNQGDGSFGGDSDHFQAGLDPRDLAVGDFDADGRTDLAVIDTADDSVNFLFNRVPSAGEPPGRGGFRPLVSHSVGTSPTAIAIGDFEADETADLVVANRGDGTIGILADYERGMFLQNTSFGAGANARAITIADFNKDRHGDVAVATDVGLVILLNDSH